MSPDLTRLTSADTAIFATLTGDRRHQVTRRLAAIQQVAAAAPGTKNKIMTLLADQLGITIGGLNMFCMKFRKSGLAAILPRDKPAPDTRPTLTRH